MRAKILFVPMSDARAEDVSPGATTARTINRSFSILELGRRQEHKRQVAAFDRECECTRALTTRRLRPAAGRARRHETSVQLSIGSRARSDEAGGWNRGRIKPYKQGTLIRARPPSTAFRPRERGLRLLPNTPPLPSSTVAKMQASSRFIR